MDKIKLLTHNIRKVISRLTKIEVGQIFYSSYYGNITATKIKYIGDGKYDIYGFSDSDGLPRNNYYPRDLELVGKEPMLNDVLEWLKGIDTRIHSINKYGTIHDTDWCNICSWDLSKPYLKDQPKETIDYLFKLLPENEQRTN